MTQHRYKMIDKCIYGTMCVIARRISKKFRLKFNKLFLYAYDDRLRKTTYGSCFSDSGNIWIRTRPTWYGKLHKLDTIVDTVCHEMAHMRIGPHNKKFWQLHARIKEWVYKTLM